MFDIFFISSNKNHSYLKELRSQFVFIKHADSTESAQKLSLTNMFWIIWDDLLVDLEFNFDYPVPSWDMEYVHSFKNADDTYFGISLLPKNRYISRQEIKYRTFLNKKEIDLVASKFKPYDIVFISYNEPTADENFAELIALYPRAKRVHGIKGIHQAHIKAAELAETEMFWVVDGDAKIVKDFKFDYQVPVWDYDTVHVWRSINPINNLVYGYGGVKLLPRKETLAMDITKTDMTTSISKKFKPMDQVSNITAFNTDPFNTWKSAFRECTKLSSKVIDRQKSTETLERLNIWKTAGKDMPYGEYAIAGAVAGAKFAGYNPDSIAMINDFDWLKDKFNEQ